MSEQWLLFDLVNLQWVVRVWERIGADKRKQLVAILAEMGRSAVVRVPLSGEERRDEP